MQKKKIELKVLNELNKGACMGKDAIHYLLDKVKDEKLKKILKTLYDEYTEITIKAEKLYLQHECKEKITKTTAINKLMTWYGIEVQTLNDTSTSKIAQLVLKGVNMGILEGRKLLNHKNTKNKISKLVEEYVTMQEKKLEKLKEFL